MQFKEKYHICPHAFCICAGDKTQHNTPLAKRQVKNNRSGEIDNTKVKAYQLQRQKSINPVLANNIPIHAKNAEPAVNFGKFGAAAKKKYYYKH